VTPEREARLLRLEDLAAINQVFVDYATFLDSGRFDQLLELFTADGEMRFGPGRAATGRDEILALLPRMTARIEFGDAFHSLSNPTVALHGDEATATTLWTVIECDDEGRTTVSALGSFTASLVREGADATWRIRLLRGRLLLPKLPRSSFGDDGSVRR
jgi:uncharacterized protein (TIGR02246 family)